MKTLNEVIKSFELSCGKKDCGQCPYDDNCLDHHVCECYERMNDALHYLKEYRKHLAQELNELRQKKYELETNMKLHALLQEKPWEKRK